jgi:hypothetical protein
VQVGNRWGYIDLEGQIVIEPTFEAAQSFTEGLGSLFGLVSRKSLVAQTMLLSMSPASPGSARRPRQIRKCRDPRHAGRGVRFGLGSGGPNPS